MNLSKQQSAIQGGKVPLLLLYESPQIFEPVVILVITFSRGNLFTWTMPTPRAIWNFYVINNIAAGFLPRAVDLFLSIHVSVAGRYTAIARSWQLTRRLMLPSRSCDFRTGCHLVYWVLWSEWTSTCNHLHLKSTRPAFTLGLQPTLAVASGDLNPHYMKIKCFLFWPSGSLSMLRNTIICLCWTIPMYACCRHSSWEKSKKYPSN